MTQIAALQGQQMVNLLILIAAVIQGILIVAGISDGQGS